MSGSTRSRQKRKLEPISIEELAGTTGMSGFCSFLTRDSSIAVPALDQLGAAARDGSVPDSGAALPVESVLQSSAAGSGASEISAPEPDSRKLEMGTPPEAGPTQFIRTSAPIPAAPVSTAPIVGSPKASAPETAASEATALEATALEATAPEVIRRRRVRIHEISTVQDGHSLAEQAVYDAMYRAGRPYRGDSRILSIGLRTLAELSRMAYSNCKANVRSLIAKLAIDEHPGFSYTVGRTYTVYGFDEILRRRKAAGLTHVIRTRGVAFVDPRNGLQLSAPALPALHLRVIRSGSVFKESVSESAKSDAPIALQSSAHGPGASVPTGILSALRRYISDVDDESAAELWQRCRENAPDARIDEILYFIDLKAGKPGIRMPLTFLMTAVPKCFKGDPFRQFREERERNRRSAADRQIATQVLQSPEADDEQKQWAREVLGP